jgi:hypothetical protein
MFSLDRSSALLEIARHSNDTINECIRADLALAGWRKGIFVS